MTFWPDAQAEGRQRTREQLRQSIEGLDGIYPVDRYEGLLRIGRLRRRGFNPLADPTRSLTLVEDENGVLLWEDGLVQARPVPGLRRGYRGGGAGGDVVERVIVEPLDPSQIGATLSGFDGRLTPNQGLREFVGRTLRLPNAGLKPVEKGRILLVIHGTFSQGQAIFDQLLDPKNKTGQALLGKAKKHYDQILAFDHPTLSVSPLLNALDLARRFEDTKADIDIICHSRGGLVTRWWLEAFDRPRGKRRAALVGAPLEGTSLASPPRLRTVLSWFSNLDKVIAGGASLFPFMTVVSCLARLTASVTSVVASTPVVDAAMAMVPGLAGMSRTNNNFELRRLNGANETGAQYYVIKSNFQSNDPGWKFWEYFVDQPLQRAAHSLFPGDNDLVVDTQSMTVMQSTSLGTGGRKTEDIPAARIFDYGATNSVFHTNYFAQPMTSQKILEWFKID